MDFSDNVKGISSFHHPPKADRPTEQKVGPTTIPPHKWSAKLSFFRGIVHCSREEFDEMWDRRPEQTVDPVWGGTISRRQGTFGQEYRFGRQISPNLGPLESAPAIVQRCVETVKNSMADVFEVPDDADFFAHANWYRKESALGAHQDDETLHRPGAPIFSFTFFMPGGPGADYRYFVVSQNGKAPWGRQWAVPLRHGDAVVMSGPFQKKHTGVFHRVPAGLKRHEGPRRINVTVRVKLAPKESTESV